MVNRTDRDLLPTSSRRRQNETQFVSSVKCSVKFICLEGKEDDADKASEESLRRQHLQWCGQVSVSER